MLTLGAATGHEAEAEELVHSLRARLDRVAEEVAARSGPAPRVLLLEWTDPPFAPGHWVPEMVTARRRRAHASARPARSRSG